MRRLVVLFVVAVIGAVLYGVSGLSSGITVNNTRVSAATLDTELQAISSNANLRCYVNALDPTSYESGAGGETIKAEGAATWSELRLEGIAINEYVEHYLKYHPDAAELATAKNSLEGEMTEQAASTSVKCPGSSAEALAAMPAEMRQSEIESQATSLYLVSRLNKAIPLTTSAMHAYYDAHTQDYDTLCVSIALVVPSKLSAFAAAQSAGDSVATLAKKFSEDSSAGTGGAYGCYAPSNESYVDVRADVAGQALNTFPTSPHLISYEGEEFGLFVAVTKRTVTPFAQAESAVLSDLKSLNAESAESVKDTLLEDAAVHVDPAFGRWGVGTAGPEVFAPATPPVGAVTGASALAADSVHYQ